MVLVARWNAILSAFPVRHRAKINYRVSGDPCCVEQQGERVGASEFARLDQFHSAFSSQAESSQMNFLLSVLQFLLGVLRHDNARLEPILARTDGRTSAPSRRAPLGWVPGWGWMISSTSVSREEARERRLLAPSGGQRRREDRPPDPWCDC
jgi:hypothetical protein